MPIKDTCKKPMDIEKSVEVPSQKPVMANDHEAGSSKSAANKYHQPRWCPFRFNSYTEEEIAAPSQQRKGVGEREDEG